MNVSRALFRWPFIRFLCAATAMLAATVATERIAAAGNITVISAGAPSPQASGVAFPATITVQSTGGASNNVCATLFTGSSGGTATVSKPATKCMGTVGDGQTASVSWTVTFTLSPGQTSGTINFIASVTWDAGSVFTPGQTVTVIPAAAPAQLSLLSVTPSKTTFFSGEAIGIDVAVKNPAASGANSANINQLTLLESTGGTNPACGPPTADGSGPLAPQAVRTFHYVCQSNVSGSFRMAANVTGQDAVTGVVLSAGPLLSALLTVQSPAAGLQVLSAVPSPTSVNDAEPIAVDVTVKNTALAGGHDATSVGVVLRAQSPSVGNASGVACVVTSPPNDSPLAPQAQRLISLSCTATGYGVFTFEADAAGYDVGTPISAVGVTPDITVTDAISPSVAIAPSPVPWSAMDLNFEITASDNTRGSGVASITVQVDGGSLMVTPGANVSVSLSAEGSHTISFFASDAAGNNSTTTAVTAGIDKTAPTISASQSPPAVAGWNNSAVTVTFACADGLSGVRSCSAPVTLSAETAGTSVPGSAADNAGNTGFTSWGPVKIDLTAPTISGAPVEIANGAGWYAQPVTVRYTCTDALSGIATCPGDVVVSSEGAGQSSSGTASDVAGNSSSATVGGINIDRTAPTIEGSRSPAANGSGWNNGAVTVSFSCSDGLSGVQSCAPSQTLAGEGAGQSATGSATDVAGNSSSATVGGINIDLTAPTISGAPVESANGAGWYAQSVTVHFSCTDALSGVAACPGDAVVSSEGAGQSSSGTASDVAGNSSSATVGGINIDRTAPTIEGSRSPAANGNGWNNGAVTVSFSCSDGLSGVQSCAPSQTLAGEGAGQSATGSATDVAGNSSSATVGGINIDRTAPAISGAAFPPANFAGWNNGPVTVSFSCSDALSGVDSCTPDVVFTGEGHFVATGAAVDRAGNATPSPAMFPIHIDLTSPVVMVPASPVVAEATGPAGAAVDFTVSAQDALSGYLPGSLGCVTSAGGVQPGAVFPLGSTAVTCAALDLAGNVGVGSFTVVVGDTTAPVLSAVSNISVETPNAGGTAVTYSAPSATDLVDGDVAVTCDHASGAVYPVGVTTVVCSATDQHGNSAATSFTISVIFKATTPPVIGKVPGTNAQNQLIAYATSTLGAVVTYQNPPATDSAGHPVPVTCTPPSGTRFAVGQNTVTCSATDANGNTATATFTVWVQYKVAADATTGVIFMQPINPDGTSIFKLGTVVPARFQLSGASAAITNLIAHISITKISDTIQGTHMEASCGLVPDKGDTFRYDSKLKAYVFNLSTKYMTQGTYQLKADLGDGVMRAVKISLKR